MIAGFLKNIKVKKGVQGKEGGETRNDEAQQGRRKKQLERCTIPDGKAELLLFPNSHLIVLDVWFLIFFCTLGEEPNSSVGAHLAAVRFSVLGCDLKMKS